MNKLIAVAVASLFAANLAFAQAPAAAPASGCEAKAVSKEGKPLAGAAKAAFMKKCEKDGKAAEPAKPGKTDQQNKMTSCNKEAAGKKGEERKAFMKECLKK